MRVLIIFFCFFIFLPLGRGQISFSKRMSNSDDYHVFNLEVDDSLNISLLLYDPVLHSLNFYYAYMAFPYNEVKAYRIFKPGVLFSFPLNFLIKSDYLVSQHYLGWGGNLSGNGIFYMDTALQTYWMYYKPYFRQGFFSQLSSGDLFILNGIGDSGAPYSQNVVEAFVMSLSGSTLLKQGLKFLIDGQEEYEFQVEEIVVDESTDNIYALLAYMGSGVAGETGSVLVVLDGQINVLSTVRILDEHYEHLRLSPDGESIYLLGEYSEELLPGVNGGALVAAFSSNLDLLWSKVFYAEYFDYKRASLNVNSLGQVFLAYSTDGAFPTILARLDDEGHVEQQLGYPFYEPLVRVMTDGSLVLASNQGFDQSGNTFDQILLVKTDADGTISGCDVFSTCLLSDDFSLVLGEVEVDTVAIEDMEPLSVIVEPWQFIFSPSCEVPLAPSPEFSFPDTLCIGACAATEGTYNANAHGVNWVLAGPNGIEEEAEGVLSFSFCFDTPGLYELAQTIWFLGCPYTYSRQVFILDELEGDVFPEGILCEKPPYSLSANATRSLVSYAWSDGSEGEFLEVDSSGVYWLEASDGYCFMRDTVMLTFWQDLLVQGEPLLLPLDTSLCERYLPYTLQPWSPYVNSFWLDGLQEGTDFEIGNEGTYIVSADVLGCVVQDTFSLAVNDCTAHIYVPSVFSPNGDGVNDVFSPLGLVRNGASSDFDFEEFRGIRLQIYDRWGGLIYEDKDAPFEWGGRGADGVQLLSSGVFVYVFEYWNILANQAERIAGEVLLVR